MKKTEKPSPLLVVGLDRRVGRQRDKWSRFEYPEDRLAFWRWRKAIGPCAMPYWNYNSHNKTLTIELQKCGRVMCYCLSENALNLESRGWRWLVAQAVRQVRATLTPNVELRGAALLRRPARTTGYAALSTPYLLWAQPDGKVFVEI